jgi:hypothetical protein
MLKRLHNLTEAVLPYLLVFVANIYHPIDPDLGWHLKYGQYFMTHGEVLRRNILSAEMPDFLWQNISWGTDVITYIFYSMGGFLGLSLAGAALVTLTFFFFAQAFSMSFWEKAVTFPVILYFLDPVNVNSFRGQLMSLLLLGILVYVQKRYEKEPGKILYIVPLLFLLWANLHGLFLLGFGIFGLWEFLYLLNRFIIERDFKALHPPLKHFIPVTVISFLATLIHPFGYGIYEEAFRHFQSPYLIYVGEYTGAEELSIQWYNFLLVAIFFGVAFTGYALTNTLRKNYIQIGLFSILFGLSLWVRRYSWAMYYFTLPFLQTIASSLTPESKRGKYIGGTVIIIISLGIVLLLKAPFSHYTSMNWETYCRQLQTCSAKGAEALKKFYIPGKTYTPYDIGGWLIWNYPDLKPTTDGRMHLWSDEKGYSGFLYAYMFEWDKKSIDSSKYDVAYVLRKKPIFNRLITLSRADRWKVVYVDSTTAIFIRKK